MTRFTVYKNYEKRKINSNKSKVFGKFRVAEASERSNLSHNSVQLSKPFMALQTEHIC
jgi:hypothetical protein